MFSLFDMEGKYFCGLLFAVPPQVGDLIHHRQYGFYVVKKRIFDEWGALTLYVEKCIT